MTFGIPEESVFTTKDSGSGDVSCQRYRANSLVRVGTGETGTQLSSWDNGRDPRDPRTWS